MQIKMTPEQLVCDDDFLMDYLLGQDDPDQAISDVYGHRTPHECHERIGADGQPITDTGIPGLAPTPIRSVVRPRSKAGKPGKWTGGVKSVADAAAEAVSKEPLQMIVSIPTDKHQSVGCLAHSQKHNEMHTLLGMIMDSILPMDPTEYPTVADAVKNHQESVAASQIRKNDPNYKTLISYLDRKAQQADASGNISTRTPINAIAITPEMEEFLKAIGT